jgi:hypothetical protein
MDWIEGAEENILTEAGWNNSVRDLLGALLGGGPGGRVLALAPCNSTVEVFPSCPRMDGCYTTHAQVTSHNSV